ncbi:MAG TPA: DUF2127 domain-containing protein [Kofleriaceae bacterium]|jgi:uncharacterized membrane protein (DUF2068 family)
MASRRSNTVLALIGVFKLVKASLLVLIAVGAFSNHLRHHIEQTNPSNHYIRQAIAKISGANPHTLHLVEIAALFYAALFLTEGFGLLWRKTWAEYFTTFITVSFIPLEVYEMVERTTVIKGLVIAANIAIVIYLLVRLKLDGRWPWKPRGKAEAVAPS